MAQKKSQVQNFEKAFDYTLFLGKYLPTFKCSSQNSTSVDTLIYGVLTLFNIFLFDLDVTISVRSGMFVVETQGMHHFVQNTTNVAQTMT